MSGLTNSISTPELLSLLGKPGIKIIDARQADAYNGWQLQGETAGGHVKGAKSLPYRWSKYIDWIEIVRSKEILPEHEIIIYSYSSLISEQLSDKFSGHGYRNVKVYPDFYKEWMIDYSLPLERLEKYQHLIPVRYLESLISSRDRIGFEHKDFVIVHAHYRNRDAYLSGHIPGAIDMDTLALEDPRTWTRRKPEELRSALESHDITSDTMVVLYGKHMEPENNDQFPGSAAGDLAAMRCAFLMLYAGVRDVRILNRGYQAWIDEDNDVSTVDEPKKPVKNFGTSIPVHPEYIVDTPEAKKILMTQGSELVCVRSWPEYIGEISGYSHIQVKGRIPGAVFDDGGSDAWHMENYRNVDQTIRDYTDISERWNRSGITPDKQIAFYCGTGWRGSEAWFNAWLMGWSRISVYDGGWSEWSSDPRNPVETGIPGEMENVEFVTRNRRNGSKNISF